MRVKKRMVAKASTEQEIECRICRKTVSKRKSKAFAPGKRACREHFSGRKLDMYSRFTDVNGKVCILIPSMTR